MKITEYNWMSDEEVIKTAWAQVYKPEHKQDTGLWEEVLQRFERCVDVLLVEGIELER